MKAIDWMDKGSCRNLPDDVPPDLFFPDYEGGRHTEQQAKAEQAKRICWTCPVRVECRAYAYTFKIQDGIWGGVWLDRGKKRNKEEAA